MRKFCVCVLILITNYSCVKDKTPFEEPNEKTIWENVSGKYDVYDSIGNYLYELEIKYINNEINSNSIDSLAFINFDNKFNFKHEQSTNLPDNLISYSINPVSDYANKNWHLMRASTIDFNNSWKNDTIKLRFRLTNIQYWITESVPYLDTIIKQIAVKQH